MAQPVFISYARNSSRQEASALHAALGPETAFLDTSDILTGEDFAARIISALLGARLLVAFVDEVYFDRWYCGKEWTIALAAFRDVLRHRGPQTEERDALLPLIVARGQGLSTTRLRRLPPPQEVQNWPAAADTAALAALVRKRLGEVGETFGERLEQRKIAEQVTSAFATAALVPPPGNLRRAPLYPIGIPPSIRERFVGRANDLWRLHHELTPPGLESVSSAAVTGAIAGGGGFGKTCLAREYFHRFGPLEYPGGLFWVDASASEEDVERQHHGILKVLSPGAPDIEVFRESRRPVAPELAEALHAVPREQRILFVLDNVPEAKAGQSPLPLDTWCPALADVTLLATSRARIAGASAATIAIDVLDRHSAVQLLCDDVDHALLPRKSWEEIAAWVGDLPLVLELLNAALRHGSIAPGELHGHAVRDAGGMDSQPSSITRIVDRQRDALRGQVPEGALRGITEALAISYDCLDRPTQNAARILAWLAPAPIPPPLLDAVCSEAGGAGTRAALISRSFVSRADGTMGIEVWRMHAVLADFLRGLEAEGAADWVGALEALHKTLPEESLGQAASREPMLASVPALHTFLSRQAEVSLLPGAASTGAAASSLSELGEVLAKLGDISGESNPALAAIRSYRSLLTVWTREGVPLDWATTQNNLGNALAMLGERETGTGRLEEAVAAFRAALEERTRERVPLDWAVTQNNLGNALGTLGERESGTARLEEAVAAYRAALDEMTRERVPLGWAATQNNLGAALRSLGARESGTARLEEAVAAFRAALEERTRERAPLGWAMTQNNLGNALSALGERESGTARLEEAVAAFRAALEEWTRERVPLDWAMTQNNLGNALRNLGERESGTGRLDEAVAAYRAALQEWTRERVPLNWATTQNNLGNTLRSLGARESGTARLEEAIEAYRAALEIFNEQGLSYYRGKAERNLGRALTLKEERTKTINAARPSMVSRWRRSLFRLLGRSDS